MADPAPPSPPSARSGTLSKLPPSARLVLRGRPAALAAAGAAFGAPLPGRACTAVTLGNRSALWLGPDECLLLAPLGEAAELKAALTQALGALPHALVDVGHRQLGLGVTGPAASRVLNAGCPLDLSPDAFPPGTCTRTLMAKAEIVLWRTAPDRFHLEVWRSFAAYVWQFLDTARADVAALSECSR